MIEAVPASPGVYAIKNLASGKVYVGSAANLQKRKSQHWADLKRGTHFNKHLSAAWTKDGEAAFVFEILIHCERGTLIASEQHYIDLFQATDRAKGYNARPRAESNLGITFSAEVREKNAAARRGKKQSPELIAKRFAPRIGRALSPRERAHIERLTEMKRGKARPDIRRWAPEKFRVLSDSDIQSAREMWKAGKSQRAIAAHFGCSQPTISYALNGKGLCYAGVNNG